jgi:methylmalonyl-CoA/ethylmalonyl-CoA epimerase
MNVVRIDHLAVAVRSLEDGLRLWESLLSVKAHPAEDLPERGVRAARLEPDEGTAVELIAPLDDDSPVRRFLESRGEGIHHLCLEVEDIDGAVSELTALGFLVLQEEPVAGAGGSRVAFIHPKSCGGVLLELTEKRKVPA